MIYWQLVAVFAVLSVLGFGGGNAIVPQMYADVVTHHHWIPQLSSRASTAFRGSHRARR